jgi:hypothetical protein
VYVVQVGEYKYGKRVKPDEGRKLYKLYQALILEAIVSEAPLSQVISVYYPCQGMKADKAEGVFGKEVKQMQARSAIHLKSRAWHSFKACCGLDACVQLD